MPGAGRFPMASRTLDATKPGSLSGEIMNGRGHPRRTLETVERGIRYARTATGLLVTAEFDEGEYPLGRVTADAGMAAWSLRRNEFHGNWRYELRFW